jgi:lysophosphatidylcholine acyltransferase/lyso-PAF acetyltransferase
MFSLSGPVDFSKPIAPWRKIVFVEAAQPVARILLWILGFVHIKQNGSGSLYGPQGKANIITSNHVSHFDILVMMATCPDGIPSFVAKRGVSKAPYVGYKSIIWQSLFVDNRAGADKTQQGTNVAQQIAERGENLNLNPVLIFPEGTTSNGESLITFRSGAFISGHPVKPVGIRYGHGNFSPAWESIGPLWHMFRCFSQFTNEVEVNWLPVYYPNDAEKKDPKLYAQNVREAIAKALKVPTVEASFADKVEYHIHIGHTKPPKKEEESAKIKKE